MALTERIVLFHDRAPQGPGHPEVYGSGLSVLRNLVPLPHARARLLLDDAPRMAVFARRFAPARCPAGERHPGGHRQRRHLPAGHPGARRGRPRDLPGGSLTTVSGPPVSRKLAINRLRERRPLDPGAVDRFLTRREVPIVEGDRCTFLYRGEADEVHVVHRIFGLPERIPLRRLHGTDLWYVILQLPGGSRIEYQLEVSHGEKGERINDPLNPRLAHSPLGSSSVCYARGYEVPEWTRPDPESRPGSLTELVVPSRALRRDCQVALYLPARFRRTARYPLLVVHDGGDYLRYASATTVLDNLIHRLDVAETVVAFVYPGDRLTEYANSAAHARYLTAELVPRLEAEFPLAGVPSARCLMGASFGAVAALSTAYRYPAAYGSLLLQSAPSFSPTSATTTAAGPHSSRW
jgi:enterochelin esterase-like enzyme